MINVRPARLADVRRMMPLLNEYAGRAEILPRTEDEVYRSVREWSVAETETKLVGMGSLLIMGQDLAEIRSLVVDPAFQGQGLGRQLVELLLQEAAELQVRRVLALTRRPGFFLMLGFQLTEIGKLPRKVLRDCVFCPKFHVCDEVALVMNLDQLARATEAHAETDLARNGDGPSAPVLKAGNP
jgi:N-acetylglutamate synthase-like GNAT family acetyltransferase